MSLIYSYETKQVINDVCNQRFVEVRCYEDSDGNYLPEYEKTETYLSAEILNKTIYLNGFNVDRDLDINFIMKKLVNYLFESILSEEREDELYLNLELEEIYNEYIVNYKFNNSRELNILNKKIILND